MRAWRREPQGRFCGLCQHTYIEKGEPVLEIRVHGMQRALVRCVRCVGPAPPDLPPLIERAEPAPTPMQRLRVVAGSLPADFKLAAAGERDPGEDG